MFRFSKKFLFHYWNKKLIFSFSSNKTLFEKIVEKQIPAKIFYEDEYCIAFDDISPKAPIHFLVVPKKLDGLTQLSKANESHKELLGHLLYVSGKLAKDSKKLENGFRVIINDGKEGGQTIFHLHIHVLGGKKFGFE